MKFRTMLLASAAVMFASSASAADITNPFFLPTEGKVLSDTSIQSSRTKLDFGSEAGEEISKGLYASETATVGLADNFAVFGTLGNEFNVDKDFNNNHNFDYKLGVKYNYNYGQVLTQVAASYNTFDPRSWYGKGAEGDNGEYQTNRWAKSLTGEIKLGYACDCGMVPYTSFSMNGDIDRTVREQEYTWFVGAHKAWDVASVDAGLKYVWGTEKIFGEDEDYDNDGKTESLYFHVAGNYFVNENVTVGAYGSLYVGGDERKDVDYDYTIGLNAKVLF